MFCLGPLVWIQFILLRGFIPLIFSKKIIFGFLMFFGTLKYGESLYGIIHKECPHIRRGGRRGVRQKWTNADRGEGVVSQMWTSAWKKNYSYHIYKIYSDNLAVCLYIMSCLCAMSCHFYVMPVCHIYFVVNPISWNAIIEIV